MASIGTCLLDGDSTMTKVGQQRPTSMSDADS